MNNRPFDNRDNDAEIEAKALTRKPRPEGSGGDESSPAKAGSAFRSHPIVRIAIFLLIYLAISAIVTRLIEGNPWLGSIILPHQAFMAQLPLVYYFPVGGVIGALVALWLMKRSEGRALWKSSGFVRQGGLVTFLIGLGAGLGISLIAFGLSYFFGRPARIQQSVMLPGFEVLLFFYLIPNLIRPVGLEIVFRGFVLQELEKKWGTFIALTGSSLLYSVFVSWQPLYVLTMRGYAESPFLLSLLFKGLVSGLFFGSAYLLRRSLWLPITIHVGLTIGVYVLEPILKAYLVNNLLTFVQIVVAIWLIVLAVQKGNWKSGPGLRDIGAGIVKIVEATDPGKEVDDVLPATRPASK
jgi:membrane protease YdiL (CAAX protease family)